MGNELLDILSSDTVHKSIELQHSIFNGMLMKSSCSFYSKRNGKIYSENNIKNNQNGFAKNIRTDFLKNFQINISPSNRKGENDIIATSEIFNSSSETDIKIDNSDVLSISSSDSVSINILNSNKDIGKIPLYCPNNIKISNGNKHIRSNQFKKKKVIVRILKSLKIESLLYKQKPILHLVEKNKNNEKTKKIKGKLNKKELFQSEQIFLDNEKRNLRKNLHSSFAGYFIEDEDSSNCSYTKTEKEKKNKKKNKTGKLVTKIKQNLSNSSEKNYHISEGHIKSNLSKKQIKKDNIKNLPKFEAVFVDTVNIEDSNSECSPLREEILKPTNRNLRTNYQSDKLQTISCTRYSDNQIKKLNNKICRKKDIKYRLKVKTKKLEKNIRIRNCKINVKNLNPKQILDQIKDSTFRSKRRRRSWSVSDVAREHDRRLNFFPEAGPSHIDYYALIKLPVVKPKVPIGC